MTVFERMTAFEGTSYECDELGHNALTSAVYKSDYERARRLLSDGMDPNVEDCRWNLPLTLSVLRGDFEMTRLLLKYNISQEQKDKALFSAPTVAELELLLDHGADLNARVGEDGQTCVVNLLLSNDRYDIMTVALRRGADIDARDDCGNTPLMHYALGNRVEECVCLLESGARWEHSPEIEWMIGYLRQEIMNQGKNHLLGHLVSEQ